MKTEEKVSKRKERIHKDRKLKSWSKLRVRMTISYVVVSVVSALLVEVLLASLFFLVILRLPFVDSATLSSAKSTAQLYALEAAVQSGGNGLNPASTFQPGQPSSIVLPEVDAALDPKLIDFVLLIAPNGQVLASSDPAHYPISKAATGLLSAHAQMVRDALAGKQGNVVDVASQGRIVSVAQPVLNKEKQPVGAIFMQLKPQNFGSGGIFSIAGFLLFTAIFWLIITAPIGAVFGALTTRPLIKRLHRLVQATGRVAEGDYSQHVQIGKKDEIGLLESQFNAMEQQLVESIEQQKLLVEQQARLEERTRIEQELRTAQYIQRALLPKDVPPLPGWQLMPAYHPAREVGGDFYDFLSFADGRLGIVIGDATDKGVSAALLMATTCTMLRTAAQESASPGEILARVNDLLAATIPTGMFVTCFYAILNPANGCLQYANAGHDLPFWRHSSGVSELRATGMPLGMMPGTRYDEQEATVEPGDSLLFYSDGLVEAHNAERDMFGFPRLMDLMKTRKNGTALIDFLLYELETFTGDQVEQEDDVTLMAIHRSSIKA
ncbi:MAG TPA: SpoIIE family protein phosphatase [Ktedonobacteraceae bacterium]|nr:SpoIIE family protein phosphatase [Ktedonobacteraceae bacterium]